MLAIIWGAIRTRQAPAVVMAILVAVTAGGLGAARIAVPARPPALKLFRCGSQPAARPLHSEWGKEAGIAG